MRHLLAKKSVLAGAAIAIIVAFSIFYRGAPQAAPVGVEASRETDEWVRLVRERAKQGYWLVVRGTHPGDQVVAAATAGTLTHAAVLDYERSEVIEATGAGVDSSPLRELLAQARRLVVVKPRGYSEEVGRAAVERARTRVGHGYDWLGTIGLPSDRRYYCTELCIDAYQGREAGWLRSAFLPEKMGDYGEVVLDVARAPEPMAVAVADDLRRKFAALLPDASGVAYAAKVAPGLYRGGVPDEAGVRWLRSIGVKTVINLRHFHGDGEGELVRAAGMRYVRIPIESTDAPKPEQVAEFLRIVTDPEAQPVYFHCLHGVDRTGAMAAIYRMQVEHWSNTDALTEMEHFGAHGLLHDLRRHVGAFTPAAAPR